MADERIEPVMIEIYEAMAEALENIGQGIANALVELEVLQLRQDLNTWHLTAK